ncbi:hypothetical protein [Marinobacter salexigens]|uniref:hypothetical protein n=1 Tax=Marinobacter salexigens TaxID=1925763 RepID=UPI000C282E88|nr:hypothetical protein [Marinobacter salexigens]
MKFGVTVLASAVVVSAVFALAMTNGWLEAIFSYRNFGWLGIGILYLEISAVIVVLFFIYGLFFGPAPRFLAALYAGCVALLAMIVSLGFQSLHEQSELDKRLNAHEEACDEYPQLCPERRKP